MLETDFQRVFLPRTSARGGAPRRAAGVAAALLFALFLVGASSQDARAQCASLIPGGGDDSQQIQKALDTSPYCANLSPGTFVLSKPLRIANRTTNRKRGAKLVGQGPATVLLPTPAGSFDTNWVLNGQYLPTIDVTNSPRTTLRSFKVDLRNLRRDWPDGVRIAGQYTVSVISSEKTKIAHCEISGSRIGAAGYTSGGTNGGGIFVYDSADCSLTYNNIHDVGYITDDPVGRSAGSSGIQVSNAPRSLIGYNTVERVAFALQVVNRFNDTRQSSSFSRVLNNTIVGAAAIPDCPECAAGRSIKLQSDVEGRSFPLVGVEIRNNVVSNFGGPGGASSRDVGGSGLHLTNDVVKCIITDNTFIGTATSEQGLYISSSAGAGTGNEDPTYQNTFDRNTFRGGTYPFTWDVVFTRDGPNQIGLGHRETGTNTFRLGDDWTRYSHADDQGCGQYAHAFWEYPAGQTFVRPGQSVQLAAAGIRIGTAVTFKFVRDGQVVAVATSSPSKPGCVVPDSPYLFSPSVFTAGTYQVYATWDDGSSSQIIVDDRLRDLVVR